MGTEYLVAVLVPADVVQPGRAGQGQIRPDRLKGFLADDVAVNQDSQVGEGAVAMPVIDSSSCSSSAPAPPR